MSSVKNDNKAVTAALTALLKATPALDFADAAKRAGIEEEDFNNAFSAVLGNELADYADTLLFCTEDGGDLIIHAVQMLAACNLAISRLRRFVTDKQLEQIAEQIITLQQAQTGSPGIPLAQKRLGELSHAINESIIKQCPQFAVGFQDETVGYDASVANILGDLHSEDGDEDDSDDDDSDDDAVDDDDAPKTVQ